MVVMYANVIEENLTYGQAMDKCIHEGKKISRSNWGGYWAVKNIIIFGEIPFKPTVFAVLKDNEGIVPATAYQEDMFATDWRVVE